MTREEAIKILEMFLHKQCDLERTKFAYSQEEIWHAVKMATESLELDNNLSKDSKWIPFEQREADEEEKEYCLEYTGYEIEFMLCGKLPEEDEEILVSYKNGYVHTDIFLRDGNDCYLDSGNEFVTEAVAWQPLPEPYKEGET